MYGNHHFIKERIACVKTVSNRLDVIQKIKPQLQSIIVEFLQARLIFLVCFALNYKKI